MPNVALLFGAGLIGAIFAGLYLLYNDEGFGPQQRYAYENDGPRYHAGPSSSSRRHSNTESNFFRRSQGSSSSQTNSNTGSNNGRGSQGSSSSQTNSNTGSNNGRGSQGSSSSRTNYSEPYDTPAINGRRRRRREDEDETCVICCDALFRPNRWILECAHAFHIECIQGWIKSTIGTEVTCPTCRSEIKHPDALLQLLM